MQSRILSPDLQFDAQRYEIMRGLGTGGAGEVFLVRDRETGEQLALRSCSASIKRAYSVSSESSVHSRMCTTRT